jgi:hypothetical protein
MAQCRLPSALTDGQADGISSAEERPVASTTQALCQPSTLGEFLQALLDGPIINTRGGKSRVARRYRLWVDAQERESLTKQFPDIRD